MKKENRPSIYDAVEVTFCSRQSNFFLDTGYVSGSAAAGYLCASCVIFFFRHMHVGRG